MKEKKEIIKIFKSFRLSITVTTNVTSANYLDVNFDLTEEPVYEPVYVNRHSNHPPNIEQQIPLSVSSTISNISSDQLIFNSSIPMYKEALTTSGINDDIIYNPVLESNNSGRKNTRKRKIT